MRLSALLVLSLFTLIATTALVIAFAADRALSSSLGPAELGQHRQSTARVAAELSGVVHSLREDALVASQTAPLLELVAASARGEGLSSQWLAPATRAFSAIMAAKPDLLQLRLIGIARSGRELIRLERSARGGSVRVVPDAELQAKGDRAYFRAAMRLRAGETYVSPIELNQEHGAIQFPKVPVLRAATPIPGDDGAAVGIVVINFDMRGPFQLLATLPKEKTFLVDSAGNYLVGPSADKEFAHELGGSARLYSDFPELREVVSRVEGGAVEVRLRGAGASWLAAAVPVAPASGARLMVVSLRPSARASAVASAQRSVTVVALLAVLAAALVGGSLAAAVARPLTAMTIAADSIPRPGSLELPPSPAAEIDALARALERMNRGIFERDLALSRQEERFRTVVEAATSGLIMVDEQLRVVLVNRRVEELFGYERSELLFASFEKLVPLEFRAQHADWARRYLLEGRAQAMVEPTELSGRRKDGTTFPASIGLSPIETAEGPCVLASILDISDRLRAEEARSLLAAIVESSDDAIVSKTLEGVISSWNEGAERMFGYTAEEAVGKPITLVVPERLAGEEAESMQRLRAGNRVEHTETIRRRKDGSEFPVWVALSPVRDGQGRVIGGAKIARDITAIRRRDDELKRSNQQLEQFAYIASHDLQEPLRMVANYTELLAERYKGKLDERADKYIFYASDGARRMQRLINDLLAYSRLGTGGKPFAPVQMESVLSGVLHTLQRSIDESHASIEHGELPVALGDEVQLRQVFQNLIGNAIKFRSTGPPRIVVEAKREGGYLHFSVSDNGIGIDMQFSERVFQMFQRLHEVGKYEGSGMGLAIVNHIVERHGGRVWVESSPGQGSTFHFTLPEAPDPPRPPQT